MVFVRKGFFELGAFVPLSDPSRARKDNPASYTLPASHCHRSNIISRRVFTGFPSLVLVAQIGESMSLVTFFSGGRRCCDASGGGGGMKCPMVSSGFPPHYLTYFLIMSIGNASALSENRRFQSRYFQPLVRKRCKLEFLFDPQYVHRDRRWGSASPPTASVVLLLVQ